MRKTVTKIQEYLDEMRNKTNKTSVKTEGSTNKLNATKLNAKKKQVYSTKWVCLESYSRS